MERSNLPRQSFITIIVAPENAIISRLIVTPSIDETSISIFSFFFLFVYRVIRSFVSVYKRHLLFSNRRN